MTSATPLATPDTDLRRTLEANLVDARERHLEAARHGDLVRRDSTAKTVRAIVSQLEQLERTSP